MLFTHLHAHYHTHTQPLTHPTRAHSGSPIAASGDATCPTCLFPCGVSGIAGCATVNTTMNLTVSFIIYLAALMSWVGWFVFSCYVGIGFVALPMDCFAAFKNRPKVLSLGEARAQRKILLNRSEELIRIGEGLAGGIVEYSDEMHSKRDRRKKGKVDAQEMNRFRVLVDMLEGDLEKFQLSDPQNYRAHYNPLVPYFKLVFGAFATAISVLWVIQIIVYMLFNPPVSRAFSVCLWVIQIIVNVMFNPPARAVVSVYASACIECPRRRILANKGCESERGRRRFFFFLLHYGRFAFYAVCYYVRASAHLTIVLIALAPAHLPTRCSCTIIALSFLALSPRPPCSCTPS